MPVSEYDEVNIYLEQSTPVPYFMEYYHRQSLEEIKKCIRTEAYHDSTTISEHLLFLEHLADKLQQILGNEQSAGESAIILRTQISEIKDLHNTLNSMHQMMNAS